MIPTPPPLQLLLQALAHHQVEVLAIHPNRVEVAPDYDIEIEANGLYKLRSAGSVIAPFADLDELCDFIKYPG